ncbi:hypothetical protein, partial [Gilliamella sp. Pas-s95]|uniref:hypothetical protein n=1 Tax=Gilliamella sp. Pas-s95 TaxID=2687317 RepID=UPI001F3E567B
GMAFDLVISKPQLTWPSKPLKAKNSPQKSVRKGIDFIKVFILLFLKEKHLLPKNTQHYFIYHISPSSH